VRQIDGRSIRFTMSRDDKWTAALKLMLTDLKMLLSWLSGNYLGGGAERTPASGASGSSQRAA
jgi:hypothetical protein